MENKIIKRIDNALLVIIAFGLIMGAILVTTGVFKNERVHKWHKMYEDEYIRVERCDCGQERFFNK